MPISLFVDRESKALGTPRSFNPILLSPEEALTLELDIARRSLLLDSLGLRVLESLPPSAGSVRLEFNRLSSSDEQPFENVSSSSSLENFSESILESS